MSVFRSDDGREIEEADLRAVVNSWYRAGAYKRVLAALALKPAPTCGAVIPRFNMDGDAINPLGCVLPPGHHPVVYDYNIEAPRCTCGRDLLHENHAPGHMPSADSWVAPQ